MSTPPDPTSEGMRRRTLASSTPATASSTLGLTDSPALNATAYASSSPPSPALEPLTPPFRPAFSRTNSTNGGSSSSSSSTSNSPRFDLPEDDPLFSGLSLLDLLNVLDAHIELLTRPLRRKSVSWKTKADRLLDEAKQRGRETFKVQLPSVPAFDLGEGLGFAAGREREREGGAASLQERKVLSQKDRERLERKYREVRERMRQSIAKLVVKWEEEKTVRLRDKISFVCGVMNVLVSSLLLGFEPTWIPAWYSLQMLVYTPYRVYTYKRKLYHYFLFDLCYFVNLLTIVYLWVFPGSPMLFEACFGLTLGSLGTAIATWRNSLVFHSLDKIISLAIHIFPPFVFVVIRHFYPHDLAVARYPALKELPHLNPWRSMAICMVTYTVWQLLYFHFVIQLRAAKIKEGRATSFTYMVNDKKRLIGKIAAKVPPQWREVAFMGGQAIYTFVTLLIPIFVLYDSKIWSSIYLVALFAISAYNGASFYMEVFARRFQKELIALRKEFDAQQQLLNRYASNPPPQTPAASTTPIPDPLDAVPAPGEGDAEAVKSTNEALGEVQKPV
ncbi:hypothetical protein NBRC10512v2_003696 [Rhodotorula toruloides]|uniref:Glycerophosphocholine acyltransferase 1 n=2 Tax=Rhodotorula toruloides TaxID=5286 RepID=A0A061AV23_RHOTO|nr:protein of DUF2838 family [Rhodotorula toruloides NP11]EMS23680.1 protein of DUF2838 family [Rhodotorula toruloides NP11]CDR40998.1 RHTO0S05e10660g1_1 [Rhodotorula toruloides]